METKYILWGLVGVAALIALSFAGWAWRYYTAPIRGAVNAEQQIESAPNRIQKYEHFFDLCASVQSKERKIDAQQELLEAAETSSERARVRANVAALKGMRGELIARYNAEASKSYTAARFHASNLPDRLSPASYDGSKTVCTYQ